MSGLCSGYGSVQVLHGIDLTVARGGLVAVIGANGAGKTTLMNTVAGHHRPSAGRIVFRERDITGLPGHRAVRAGIALVPEGRHVAAPLTVLENLTISRYARRGRIAELRAWVFELFPRLAERQGQQAGLLSGGEQQMLAMGRALMTNPDLLLLDEPTMGLAPSVADQVYEALVQVHKDSGMSILLVEQNAELALTLADYAYVIRRGEVAVAGAPAEVRATREFEQAYLG
ncbi:ABC transporter ATP-binding protein [Dactylosporangium sp. CA-139066]|uniref:ABC transporter ATP-binding protein n=1 Tax=Dactylosporangium sp. CA-139066 TaxID=3239930 RepID=UPI003D8BE833